VEGLAGTLEIESEPGAGTAICARIPALPPEGAR
jgi:signal transduction histidine kinase